MRQASSTGPAAVSKYLLPREVQVATVRQHPAVLLASGSQALAGLLVAGLLSLTVFKHNHLLLAIVWIAWAVLLLRLIWKAINWAVDYFVITSQRLMLTTGLLTRKVAMMPMSKVTDMSFRRSFGGRLLGYGELIVESAGQNQALDRVPYIPYPEQLYLLVCGILFPAGAEEPSDEL
ncbi:MAG: PH domain-containing protein [Streptosporangiaceae bacterium]